MHNIFPRLYLGPILLALVTVLIGLHLIHYLLIQIWTSTENTEKVFVDDQTYVTHLALRNQSSEKKTVIFVGGSVTREGSLLDSAMQNMFKDKTQKDINFLNLGSSSQSLLESLQLLKTIKINPGSIVYIQFSFKKLDYSYADYKKEVAHPRLPLLESSGAYDYANYYGKIIYSLTPKLILARDFTNYFAKNKNCQVIEMLTIGSACYLNNAVIRNYYKEENRLTIEKKDAYVRDIEETVYPEFISSCAFGCEILSDTIDYITSRGGIPVLIEYPISSREKSLYTTAKKHPLYKECYSKLSNKSLTLDLAFDERFFEEDFFDSQHMLVSGKMKTSALIIDHAISIMNGDIKYELP